jgi:hypothetical protein
MGCLRSFLTITLIFQKIIRKYKDKSRTQEWVIESTFDSTAGEAMFFRYFETRERIAIQFA